MNIGEQILKWYLQSGVDEIIGTEPVNRLQAKPAAIVQSPQATPKPLIEPTVPSPAMPDNLFQNALDLANAATSLDELKKALESFDGCALKKTAKNTVFGQGNCQADVMFIGEAPGADEDRLGMPFVGLSGQLLDKMMDAVGLSRQTNVYISNIIPWRPPGNRSPSDTEILLCLPFIKKHIELICPKVIVTLGGIAFSALMGPSETISRARGVWHEYQTDKMCVPLLPVFHPAFLLRTPAQKKATWHDFLMVAEKIEQLSSKK